MLIILWRISLVLLCCATANALFTATVLRQLFAEFFPGAIGEVYFGLVAVACLGLVAIAGLWQWRRWAMVLFIVLGVAGFVLDILASAPVAHKIASASATLLVAGLAYLLRDRFGVKK